MAVVPVSKETMADKYLKPLNSFDFVAQFPVCEVVLGEMSTAAANFPIFFLERDGSYSPIVMLSLVDGQNMFVETDGKWSGAYIPAAFRRYPFSVAQTDLDGEPRPILMIDDSLLSDKVDEGEKLFGADDAADAEAPVGRALRLIGETDHHHLRTRELVKELADLGLISPANLQVTLDNQPHNIGGLFGIDEKKLSELSDEDFLKLRKSGALSVAHLQLVSVGQVQRLIVRHNARDLKAKGQPSDIVLD